MTSVRGKLVTIGGERRFFPMVSGSPAGALDSAAPEREREVDEDELKREEAIDVRECEGDMREAANDEEKDDKEARDRKRARDARAIARDKRAHDRRARSARDEEMTDEERERAYPRTNDANPDHRNDWRPAAAGGPDNPAVDAALRLAFDMRKRAAATNIDLDAMFMGEHQKGNAVPAASVDVNAIFGGRA